MEKIFETEINGRKLIAKIGQLAGQANGAALVQYGETVVLATAVIGKERSEIDYFPLLIDYEERFYAAGKIKGSRFIKRETRPPDEAILAGRLIDRSLRPLFNQDLRRDVQIVTTVLAVDQENDPDLVALYAASLALTISDIPWDGPVAGVRIGRLDGKFVLNPTYQEREKSDLDLVVCGPDTRVIMLEAGAQESSEETVLEAIKFGARHVNQIVDFFKEVQKSAGKPKLKFDAPSDEIKKEKEKINKIIAEFFASEAPKYLFKKNLLTKEERTGAAEKIRETLDKILIEKNIGKEKREKAMIEVNKLIYGEVGRAILEKEKRVDGRGLDQIRSLSAQVGVLPRVHGSAIFQRGETQILSTVTLGAPGMEQYLDTMEESGRKRFMHHYNFPPFSSGEVSPLRTTGRRETGHSMLVEKGLAPMIPHRDNFSYTIRVVSEALSSNGSTSMASACASALALMDAGVPIKKPVAGVAVGLASEEDAAEGEPRPGGREKGIKRFKTFIDLQDLEDGPGGMDFKVIGTKDGITAIQMDTKTHGLSLAIIEEALKKAHHGRLEILDFIVKTLAEPREKLSPYAPQINAFRIDPQKIKNVIGPSGKVINEIIAKTGVTIDVEKDGLVSVTSSSSEAMERAVTWIKDLVREIKVGEIFRGKVKKIVEFGAFVEFLSGDSGLIHISELAPLHVKNVADILEVGEIVPVKIIQIDDLGRINLSLKQAVGPDFYQKKKIQ